MGNTATGCDSSAGKEKPKTNNMQTATNTISPDATKSKTKKTVLISLSALALGTLAFLGIKRFKKTNHDNNQTNPETEDKQTTDVAVQSGHVSVPRTRLPAAYAGDAFPLRLGSKGAKVKLLQQVLIRSYGASILPKYGADGWFGTELETALRSKGYAIPLKEAEYQKIISQKEEEATTKPLLSFDPAAIAKGLYYAILAKDFNSVQLFLKTIGNTKNYIQVSNWFKNYRIRDVRQTIVNALLSSFPEKSQKEMLQKNFRAIGLKFDGNKWSI